MKKIASYVLFINKRIFCVPSFVRFLLTFKMRELFLPHPVATCLFDYTFLHDCLPMYLLSQKLNCTIYTATVLPQVVFSCMCLTFIVTRYWTLCLNCWHWGLWLGLRFDLKCGYKLPCHSFLKASAAIIPRIRPWICPSRTFPIHYWLIILSFNAI